MRALPKALIILPVLFLTASAQTKPSNKSVSPIFTEKRISFSSSKLPPFCLGNDPQLLVRSLSRRIPDKGEFETTPQYEKRVKAENGKPILGGLTVKDTFATTFDHYGDNEEGIPIIDYNADKGAFNVLLNMWSNVNHRNSICIKHFKVNRGRYASDEGRVIDKEDNYWFQLSSDKFDVFRDKSRIEGKDFEVDNVNLTFPCKIETAKRIKPNLRIMAFYRLTDPGLVKETERVWPTSYLAVNGWKYDFYLNSDVVGLWVYDIKTGTVLWKFPAPFQSPPIAQQ